MIVFAIQLDLVWHDKAANHRKADVLIDRTNIPPGSLIVLPEMFGTGFSMDLSATNDDVDRQTDKWIHETAKRTKSAVVCGRVSRAPGGRGFNEAVVAFPDGQPTVRYQKLQPFNLGGEGQHYDAGQKLVLFEWQGFQIAPFICYDLRFPELFRAATLAGAQVLVDIASWPIVRDEHWVTLLKARAIENLAYVVGVNRCGKDPGFYYSGKSLILDVQGRELANAGGVEGVAAAKLEKQALLDWRQKFPALNDIRPEYREALKRAAATH